MIMKRGSRERSIRNRAASDRVISLGSGLAAIPERLLLAHARGEVLFIAGAGISQPASLPDFRSLVLEVYNQIDTAVHAVKPFSNLDTHFPKSPKRPKKVEDLFSMQLVSGSVVDPSRLELPGLTDCSFFLVSLAFALDFVIVSGLDIARRTGWDGKSRLWRLGWPHRVYYVPLSERADGEHEPDEFHQGIAPSVKLLHAVVSRLVDIDTSSAVQFVYRWEQTDSPIHVRLWAALSRDSRVTSAKEVGAFLLSLDNRHFWDLHNYPEIAEVRARRFSELDPHEQAALTVRIRKRPPRNQWPKRADADKIKNKRIHWVARELRRIEIAGAHLSKRDKEWLDARVREFPDLAQMARLDEGFPGAPKVRSALPNPDSRYDLLSGEERLKALETALASAHGGWHDEPDGRAADWIRQPRNPVKVLVDLESSSNGGIAFARVWERFGWAHSPEAGQGEDVAQRDLPAETVRVLSLLDKLPEATLRQVIGGISHWFSAWEKQIVLVPEGFGVWFKLWPIAVDATNEEHPAEEEIHLNTAAESSNPLRSMDLDTLNTPAGKLVGVFLVACPKLRETDHPFDNGVLHRMRDSIIAATGRSRLIALYRMIEALPYFLRADRDWADWAHEHLIRLLLAGSSEAMTLWRAIARRTQFTNVLKIIGDHMAKRATDQRLDRETRHSLVFSLIIECLHAFREQRQPAVPYARIQQMIRTLDDEVRAYGAEAVPCFVRDVAAAPEGGQASTSPEQLFRTAAAPFLQQVWPQERSLATPGVSRALAELPAITQEAFAEAVDAIERFLVPFECWSMIEYGLYGDKDGKPNLSSIDNHVKAAALLRLFDLTIGTAEGAVIPDDLADALEQVRRVAPGLTEGQVFRRLATTARR